MKRTLLSILLAALAAVIFIPAAAPAQSAAPAPAASAQSAPADLVARAREAYNARRFRESATLYGEYLKTYPQGPDRDEAGFFQGQSLFLLNELAAADAALAREESVNRQYADQILFYRGEIAGRRRDFNTALIFYDRLLTERPDSALADKARERRAELHFRQGDAYYNQGAYSLALQQYKDAEGAPAELKPVVAYRRGLCSQKLNQPDQAAAEWADLAAAAGTPAGGEAAVLALYRLARLAEDRGDLAAAELDFQKFIEVAPDHRLAPLAHEGLARVQAGLGKTDEAAAYWREHGQGKELLAAADRFESAIDHLLHEEYPDAAREFSALAASADPELSWLARLWLARVYTREGRAPEARAAWQEVAASPRASDPVRLEYAAAVLDSDPALARELAAAVAPRASGVIQEEALHLQAEALWRLHSPEAKPVCDSGLTRFPSGRYAADFRLIRGLTALDFGPLDSAEKDLLAAAEHPDPGRRALAKLGLIRLFRLSGRPESALEVLVRARDDVAAVKTPEDELRRQEAEISFGRGDYERGLTALAGLCPGPACSERDRMRIFFGNYRAGNLAPAADALTALSSGSPDAAFFAGFWQGMMFFDSKDYPAAADSFRLLKSARPYDQGLVYWMTARALMLAGRSDEATAALAALDSAAPESGFYTRGQRLKIALGAGDFKNFLASLPKPEELDREALSEEKLLAELKKLAETGAPASALNATNRMLQVESTREEVTEEGVLIVARSQLNGPNRAEALAALDRLITRHPDSKVAPQVKYYRGEDAFLKKDFAGALAQLEPVEPVDLPPELRFGLLYLKGQSYKMTRDLDRMRPVFLTLVRDYKNEPADPRRWLDVGVGLTLAREFTAARTALDRSLAGTKDPRLLVEATYWKGMVEAGSGNDDAALAIFLSIPEKFPDQGMWTATALYEAAGIYTERGDYDQALATYERALGLVKGDASTTNAIKGKIAEVKKLKSLRKPG